MTAETAISGAMRRPPIPVQPIYDLALGSPYRSAWRLAAFMVLVSVVAAVGGIVLALKSRRALDVIPPIYHRICCWLLDIHIEIRGDVSTVRPTLFVCNHSSYLDISVLGSILRGSFVAKAEVANWPLFGYLAKLQRTVFVDRQRRATTHQQRDQLVERLDSGDNLILFPEGTSNDGNRTLPFRSALFGVAERKGENGRSEPLPLTIQPVSLAYVRLNGMPIGRALRPYLAWYGDMELLDHLWHVAGLGRITVAVEFHPPVTLAQFASRKALSEHCQRAVAEGVASALAGRRDAVEKAAAPPPAASAKKYP
jgi:1-acyl-sn-glycerol-3-phosphate acyltransferase